MARLWQDIETHWRSSAAFGGAWVVVCTLTVLTWHDGLPVPIMAALVALPFAAGALAGWWRITPAPAEHRPCGMLAGAVVALFDTTIVFVLDWAHAPTATGEWEWDVVGLWLVIGAIFALIGAAIGLAGGVAVQTICAKPAAPRA